MSKGTSSVLSCCFFRKDFVRGTKHSGTSRPIDPQESLEIGLPLADRDFPFRFSLVAR